MLNPGTIIRDIDIKWLRFEVIERGYIGAGRKPGYRVRHTNGHEAGRETFAPDGQWVVCEHPPSADTTPR